MPIIKTPDQRVRVFVSSTLQELRSERIAAKEAITKLRLIPVLFESGARPHPPRELYRAYLDQSHIFVGIYWNSYGWVAPDMNISGIEDEFQLSGSKARLIYVKHSDQRQPELQILLSKIQESDSVTFQKFETIEEFRELLENDLALLLSERFDLDPKEVAGEKPTEVKYNPLPYVRSVLIGRENELKKLNELLSQSSTGLVTMTGAGGTGKTRLAIEVAHDMKEAFPAGVCFVPLAAVSDPSLVVPTIANAMGLLDTGHQSIHETLIAFLFEKKLLLLLDNFEQVVEAGPMISELLSRCPLLKVLITSRTPLQIRDERIYPVTPLALPGIEESHVAEEKMTASVRLFIEQARQVNPGLVLTTENVEAINGICRKLDGLPLAIELAAARTRLLSPVALMDRMDQSLDILSHGPRDLPERHQTMRATIDWSYNLLDENDCTVLRHLSVFSDGWTLESAEAVMRGTGSDIDILDYTDRLLNAGLIFPVEHDPKLIREQRFSMLQTVREYAQGILAERNEAFVARSSHAEYYLGLLDHAKEILWDKDPIPSLLKLDADYQNISLGFAFFHETQHTEKTWRIIGALVQYWSARGRFSEAFAWMDLAQIIPDTRIPFDHVSAVVQGDAFYSRAVLTLLAGKNADALLYCQRSIDLYQTTAQWQKMARAQTYLGSAAISIRDPRAIEFLHEALRLGETHEDEYSYIISSAFLGEVYTAKGDLTASFGYLSRAEAHARKQPQQFTLAITLLQKANYYLIQNDVAHALEASQESVAVFEMSAFKSMKGWAQGVLGQCYLMSGDLEHAQKYFNQCLLSGREAGDRSMQLHSILGTASITFMKKDLDTAATLCGSIEAMLARNEYATWSTVKKLFNWLNQQLTTNMPEPGLTQAKTRGSQLSFGQTVALVSGM